MLTRRFSAFGRIPLIAPTTLSDSSLIGLLVHPTISGMMAALISLDRALALELAMGPVATSELGGAVIGIGTGVEKAPPKITGMSCVDPETTEVRVEITGCWSIRAALNEVLAL